MHVQMTSALVGKVGVAQNLTNYDEGGGRGGIQMSYLDPPSPTFSQLEHLPLLLAGAGSILI